MPRATKDQIEAIKMLIADGKVSKEDIFFKTREYRCYHTIEYPDRWFRDKQGYMKTLTKLEDLTREEADMWIGELQGEGIDGETVY